MIVHQQQAEIRPEVCNMLKSIPDNLEFAICFHLSFPILLLTMCFCGQLKVLISIFLPKAGGMQVTYEKARCWCLLYSCELERMVIFALLK